MWDICRTCMTKEVEMISIFDQSKSPSINDMLMTISSLEFSPNDTLPSEICITCFQTVEMTYYFKEQVIKCNDSLQKQAQRLKLLERCKRLAQRKVHEVNIKKEPESYIYNNKIDCVTIIDSDDEISAEHVATTVDYTPSECQERLISTGNKSLSTENDEKSLNFALPLKAERRHHDLPEESSSIHYANVDSHFDETSIKYEEVEVVEHDMQFEDKCKITPQEIMSKNEADDKFHADHDLLVVSTGSYNNIHAYNNIKSSKSNAFIRLEEQRVVERTKAPKCEACKETFSTQRGLRIHMRTHTGETHRCHICNASFKWQVSLDKHMYSHTGKRSKRRKYRCEVCGKPYKTPGYLEVHMRLHTGERPYECQLCSSSFTRAADLTFHMRLHSRKPPLTFKCDVCGITFVLPSHLKKHMKQHARAKPFKCTYCKAKFKREQGLDKHLQNIHGVESRCARLFKVLNKQILQENCGDLPLEDVKISIPPVSLPPAASPPSSPPLSSSIPPSSSSPPPTSSSHPPSSSHPLSSPPPSTPPPPPSSPIPPASFPLPLTSLPPTSLLPHSSHHISPSRSSLHPPQTDE